MRFALDGLPRDLSLSREERRELVVRMNGLKSVGFPMWVAIVPAAAMLLFMFIWMPAIYYMPDPWRLFVVVGSIVAQLWVSLRIMHRVLWPFRCRRMAMAGCEVCPRCAYVLRDAPASVPICSECGANRIVIS